MSKTALFGAIRGLDVAAVRAILGREPALHDVQSDRGPNVLQMACARATFDDPAAAVRQVKLVTWLIDHGGFDPRVTHTTKPGEDGEARPSTLSLVFFAVARARNDRLARLLLDRGVHAEGLYAAAWWGSWRILGDLIRHGAKPNVFEGASTLHMAIAVLDRGTAGKPQLARDRVRTVEEFLRLGDPNLGEYRGDTPLYTALAKGCDPEVFALLLKHGANPDVPGRGRRTVRDVASRKQDRCYIDAIERAPAWNPAPVGASKPL